MSSDSSSPSGAAAKGDQPPKDFFVGCINPYALVEDVLGRKVDWEAKGSSQLLSDVLQKQYDELFDIKYGSPLYAGLKLASDGKTVVQAKASEIKVLDSQDSATPNLAVVKKLEDLHLVGVNNLKGLPVNNAWLTNGKLNLQLKVPSLNKTMTNLALPKAIYDIVVSGSSVAAPAEWTPPNGAWKDVGDFSRDVTEYDDPIQGGVGDCWLIAALSAVAWSLPYTIVHRTRSTGPTDNDHVSQLTFYSKGGIHDAPTGSVEVGDEVVVGANGGAIWYARSRDAGELWPSLYEKAFAKWSTGNATDKPNILALAGGDPAKACAQLTGRRPVYYQASTRTPDDLWGLVRSNSAGGKTVNPMTAWTYGSGSQYSDTTIAANHAYTILGWAFVGNKKYIVLRNPWGRVEPSWSTTHQGVITLLDGTFWRPINMIGNDGIFAIEAAAFKVYYAWMGVAVV